MGLLLISKYLNYRSHIRFFCLPFIVFISYNDWSNKFARKKIKCSTCQVNERGKVHDICFRLKWLWKGETIIVYSRYKTNQTITKKKKKKKKTCIQKQSAQKCLEMIPNRKSQCLFYEHKFAIRFFFSVMMDDAHLLVFLFLSPPHSTWRDKTI